MSWTDVRIIEDELTESQDGRAKGRRVYIACSDAPASTDSALLASASGVTVAGRAEAFSASRPYCRAEDRRVERLNKNSPFDFTITCDFADPEFGPGGATSDAQLLALPAKIDNSRELVNEEYVFDASVPPKPVMNTAKEPFDKNPLRIKATKVFTIQKYVTPAVVDQIEAAEETINKQAKNIRWQTFDAENLFLESASFDEITPNRVYLAKMIIKYRRSGWVDRTMNIGFAELKPGIFGTHSTREPIMVPEKDSSGNVIGWVPTPTPWPLNEDGTKYPSVLIDPIELVFRPYPKDSWIGVPLA